MFKTMQKVLVSLDLILFAAVLILILSNLIATDFGIAVLLSWVVVFFATIISLTRAIKQGSDEWYHYGIMITTGILIAMVVGIILGFDIYGIVILTPITVAASLALNWMFTDRSEDAIDEDLKKLQKEIPQ